VLTFGRCEADRVRQADIGRYRALSGADWYCATAPNRYSSPGSSLSAAELMQ